MSKIEGVAASLVLLAIVAACLYFGGEHHGETSEKTAVSQATASAQAEAIRVSATWKNAAVAALHERDAEAARLATTQFVPDPAPSPVRVPQYTRAPGVPANPAPAGRAGAASGECPANLVPATSDELRQQFEFAKQYDSLTIDYRELYDAWPQSSVPPARH